MNRDAHTMTSRDNHDAPPLVTRPPLILGYHAVSATWKAQLSISATRLGNQLGYLKRRGFVGLTLSGAEHARRAGTLPPRAVVVTFDDGYASTLNAAPILEEVGFPGTVFVVTDFVDSGELLSWYGIDHWHSAATFEELRPVTWDDTERLVARGWEIGSHTATHPLLTTVDDARLRSELTVSRKEIERRVGTCTALAYPYGLADERVAEAARQAGYEVGCTLTFAHLADEPLRRPRIGMESRDQGVRLVLQVSRLGQAARRSLLARVARKLRRHRPWLPPHA